MTYNPGTAAGAAWREDCADMLLSFDKSALDAAIMAYFRTDLAEAVKGAETDDIYIMLNVAFATLYNRRVIAPVRPLSDSGSRILSEILQNFTTVRGPEIVENPELPLVDQVVSDWHSIDMKAFGEKRRANPEYETAFNRAVELGRI